MRCAFGILFEIASSKPNIIVMNYYPNDLRVDTFNSHFSENEFYNKYLKNSSFRGFYYDINEKSYGIVLHFPQDDQRKLILNAIESDGILPVVEYQISTDIFLVDVIAYDKVLITTAKYSLQAPVKDALKVPRKLEFTLQLLTRNTLFIRFTESDKYTSAVKSLKGGLVLSRENSSTEVSYVSSA
jgi:hypothetical protein